MKEIFSISGGLDVAKTKPIKTSNKEILSDEKDFLSIMFTQIKESINISNKDTKLNIDLDEKSKEEIIELNTPISNEKKSYDEHLLEDILKIVNILKNPNDKNASFPSLSKRIEKVINNEQAFNDLKKVDNLTDLLKLSKKYDLGLEKLSVKKTDFENLKKEFPLLTKKEFFDTPKESIKKDTTPLVEKEQPKPTVVALKVIEPKNETKKEPTLLEKIMSSNENKKEEIPKTSLHVEKKESKTFVEDTKTTIKEKAVEEKKELHVKSEVEVKKVTKESLEKEAPKVVINDKKEFTKIKKEELHTKAEKEAPKPDVTRVSEVKVESNIPKQSLMQDLLQTRKPEQPTMKQENLDKITTISQEDSKLENITKDTNELKSENLNQKADFKPTIKTDNLHQKPVIPTKETFTSFADDLREKIEQYKPPIMKVQMALNPKGLGEVDVTILNRGNNLHVNITSNTNTMNIFTQNQAEFKNSLVNMGFTNLEMNFSDQRESKEQQQGKSSKGSIENIEDEIFEEENTSLELVVPRYI
jgi:hypothetical protein